MEVESARVWTTVPVSSPASSSSFSCATGVGVLFQEAAGSALRGVGLPFGLSPELPMAGEPPLAASFEGVKSTLVEG